ncbi:hypothetical protein F383_34006 [Gossypium arboreum]|uniref:Uncharacterized protein n=1 Tax=Gossypium arboreum TaxID=29729 RepID=A0A0B0PSY8_GOSAR|nr:hypothetical protein F383_34006 [Gossypium arboreum]
MPNPNELAITRKGSAKKGTFALLIVLSI